MKKRSYRAQNVNEVRWEEVADRVRDKAVVWAVDVAKVEQYGVLMDSERQVVITLRWAHPAETPALLEREGRTLWVAHGGDGVHRGRDGGDGPQAPASKVGVGVSICTARLELQTPFSPGGRVRMDRCCQGRERSVQDRGLVGPLPPRRVKRATSLSWLPSTRGARIRGVLASRVSAGQRRLSGLGAGDVAAQCCVLGAPSRQHPCAWLSSLLALMGGAAHLGMEAEALRVDAAHGGQWRLCREGLQAQHFLARPRPEHNAVGAGCRLQRPEREIRIGVGEIAHAPLFDEEALARQGFHAGRTGTASGAFPSRRSRCRRATWTPC